MEFLIRVSISISLVTTFTGFLYCQFREETEFDTTAGGFGGGISPCYIFNSYWFFIHTVLKLDLKQNLFVCSNTVNKMCTWQTVLCSHSVKTRISSHCRAQLVLYWHLRKKWRDHFFFFQIAFIITYICHIHAVVSHIIKKVPASICFQNKLILSQYFSLQLPFSVCFIGYMHWMYNFSLPSHCFFPLDLLFRFCAFN